MTVRPDRRRFVAAAIVIPALIPTLATAGTVPTLLVEQTYLKAVVGQRAALIGFIKANWFVMDQRGIDAGIFTWFTLFEDIDDNPDWDIVMAVGYPQAAGYDDPAAKRVFDAIRAAHVERRADGRPLSDLGRIVQHHRLRIA